MSLASVMIDIAVDPVSGGRPPESTWPSWITYVLLACVGYPLSEHLIKPLVTATSKLLFRMALAFLERWVSRRMPPIPGNVAESTVGSQINALYPVLPDVPHSLTESQATSNITYPISVPKPSDPPDYKGKAPWVADMAQYLGAKETPSSTSVNTNTDGGGIIDRVQSFFGVARLSWCMSAVLYFLIKNGRFTKAALAALQEDKAKNPRGWSMIAAAFAPMLGSTVDWPASSAEYGDIVYMFNPKTQPSPNPAIGTGHVGFVIGRSESGTILVFLAGNDGNAISIASVSPESGKRIMIVSMGSGIPVPVLKPPYAEPSLSQR